MDIYLVDLKPEGILQGIGKSFQYIFGNRLNVHSVGYINMNINYKPAVIADLYRIFDFVVLP